MDDQPCHKCGETSCFSTDPLNHARPIPPICTSCVVSEAVTIIGLLRGMTEGQMKIIVPMLIKNIRLAGTIDMLKKVKSDEKAGDLLDRIKGAKSVDDLLKGEGA